MLPQAPGSGAISSGTTVTATWPTPAATSSAAIDWISTGDSSSLSVPTTDSAT